MITIIELGDVGNLLNGMKIDLLSKIKQQEREWRKENNYSPRVSRL